jgi:hypothetical protein
VSRVLVLLLLCATGAEAADVSVTFDGAKLGARLGALPLPATLSKELTSGLTNRLHVRVSLLDARDVVAERILEVAIRFDLWDETFLVNSSIDGAKHESLTLATLAEVDALLRALPMPRLFDTGSMPVTREMVLRVQVLLNPIDREKMRMIRKWVAQNSMPGLEVEQGASMSSVLFNRIFEQYEGGSSLAAAWHVELSSAPFRLDRLRHEER